MPWACVGGLRDRSRCAGCAGANDPYESTNRKVFKFNNKLDDAVVLADGEGLRVGRARSGARGIHNFLLNLDLPITFVNDILQGEATRASQTLGRFTMNSTIGIGGLFDPATGAGIPYHEEDFGQTLGAWGMERRAVYRVAVPGPDPPRDAAGQVVDIFLDPTTYIQLAQITSGIRSARDTLYVLDLRARNIDTLEGIERSSIDYYASVRSLYRQRRNNEIRNGQPDTKNLPDL